MNKSKVPDSGKFLRRLAPHLKSKLPGDLTPFFTFVGEQDLLHHNPFISFLTAAQLKFLIRKIENLSLPEWEKLALEGYALICAGQFSEAARHLERALFLKPSAARLKTMLAASLWLLGDQRRDKTRVSEALRAAEEAIAAGEKSREALLIRAQIRFELEDNEGGLADLERILKKYPADFETRIGKAEKLTDSRRYAEALAEQNRLVRKFPRAWWIYAQRGRTLGFAGKMEKALKDFDLGLKLNPRAGSLYSWRAEALRKMGRYQEARRDLNRACRLDPLYAFSWECRGRLKLMEGDVSGALEDLNRACRLDPTHLLAFAWRAEAAFKLGDIKRAREDFDRVAPLHPRTTWNMAVQEGKIPSAREREIAFWADIAKNADFTSRFKKEAGLSAAN